MVARKIFEWAAQTPESVAVVYNGQSWSYRAFASLIEKFRGYFSQRECIGEGFVVLAVNNLVVFWVLSLALRSLGLTTIAVQSVENVASLTLPKVRCVFTSSRENWPSLQDICRDKGWPLHSVSLNDEQFPHLSLGEMAQIRPGGHVLQTSGTTGTYKNILMDPSFEEEYMRFRRQFTGVTQGSVVSVFGFGAWTGGCYKSSVSAWMAGATVLIHQAPEPHKVLLYPGITHALLTPYLLDEILAIPEGELPLNKGMCLTITGGNMTQAKIDEARARITPHLFNGLSSTETNVFGFTPINTLDDRLWHRIVPGREVQIVDEFDHLVPTGVTGRLRVSTDGGPTGYLYDDVATQSFFTDGFFYPGDLGLIRSDGRLALVGRTTDVINVRGQKISPSIIEDKLKEMLGISGLCLFSSHNDMGEESFHIAVEAIDKVKEGDVTRILNQELSGFLNAQIHFVAVLPRNHMGKVQRLAIMKLILEGGYKAQ